MSQLSQPTATKAVPLRKLSSKAFSLEGSAGSDAGDNKSVGNLSAADIVASLGTLAAELCRSLVQCWYHKPPNDDHGGDISNKPTTHSKVMIVVAGQTNALRVLTCEQANSMWSSYHVLPTLYRSWCGNSTGRTCCAHEPSRVKRCPGEVLSALRAACGLATESWGPSINR